MLVLHFISVFCVAPAMLAPLFTAGADSAGYQIIASYLSQKSIFKKIGHVGWIHNECSFN
jgi:hypothetical protein